MVVVLFGDEDMKPDCRVKGWVLIYESQTRPSNASIVARRIRELSVTVNNRGMPKRVLVAPRSVFETQGYWVQEICKGMDSSDMGSILRKSGYKPESICMDVSFLSRSSAFWLLVSPASHRTYSHDRSLVTVLDVVFLLGFEQHLRHKAMRLKWVM